MMLRLSRRKLFKLGLAGGGLLGAAGVAAWFGRDRIREISPGELADYLKSNFDYLTFNFDQDQMLAYIKDYREAYHVLKRKSWYVFRGGDASTHEHLMEHFLMTFLLSTDFFMHGADESRQINYVMFYHPYRSPCWNPISMGSGNS